MSRTDIPEWVRLACSRWGRQKRRIWSGRDWHGNVDGYAESLLGRIRDEREGAGQGMPSQKWPEVFWGDGLDVQRALVGMSERSYRALHFQYVWDPEWNITAAKKAEYMQVKRAEYFIVLETAETWVHARLEPIVSRPDTQLIESVNEIIRNALQSGCENDTKAHSGETPPRKQPDINLAALRRSKLTVSR